MAQDTDFEEEKKNKQPQQQPKWKPDRWVNPNRISYRQRMDRRLERAGLLNYQTEGLSQEEIARRYAAANITINNRSSWFQDNYGFEAPSTITNREEMNRYRAAAAEGNAPNIMPQVPINLNPQLTPSGGNADRPVNFVTGDNGLLLKVKQEPFKQQAVSASPFAGDVFATLDQAKAGEANWTDISADDRAAVLKDPNFYKSGAITQYPTWMQQQILADPSFEWDALPKWQRAYFELSSSPAGMGAAQGALMGLGGGPAGIVVGAGVGALLGWAAGKSGYDATKEFWQQDSKIAAGFGLMNWLAEQAEKTAGLVAQGIVIITGNDPNFDPKKRNLDVQFNPEFNLLPGEKFNPELLTGSSWDAGAGFYEVIGPAYLNAIGADDGKFTAIDVTSRIPLVALTKLVDVMVNPEKYKGEEVYLGAEQPIQLDETWVERLHNARDEIKAGRPYREVMMDLQTGVMAQVSDMALQAAGDPLNVMPNVTNKVGGYLAEAGGNRVAAEAFRGTEGLPDAARKYKTLVQTGQALTIDPQFRVDQMGVISRWVAGINKQGQVKAGSLFGTSAGLLDPIKRKQGWLEDMVTQTPHSRAQTGAGLFYENIGILLQMFDTPETAVKYIRALSNNDMNTWRELGSRFAESPEFYTVLPALKDFTAGKLDGITQAWEMTAPNRDLLARISDVLGDQPGTVLEDLAKRGTAEQDFQRVVKRLQESGSAEAKALLADVQAGRFTAETLKQMVDVFTGDGALPWHPGQWKAMMLDQLGDHFDQWVTQRLMLDKSPEAVSAFFRTAALMKQAQSILLLGGSPGYAITNGLSNMVSRAISGVFGFMTPRQIDTFIERMGITPARFDEGVGIGGVVEQAAGKSAVKMDAMNEAVRGKGPLTTAKDVLARISKGMPFSKVSAWFERLEGKQAFTIAMRDFWSNSWRRGVGFREMSPELMRAMSDMGMDPKRVYAAIEAGMNQAEIERAIFGRQNEIQARSLIHDAAEKTGMSATEAAQMLERIGILDTLDQYLKGQTTKDGVQQAFRRAERQANDWMDLKAAEDLRAQAEHVKNRVGVEGAVAALDIAQRAHGEFTDAWMDHYHRFGEVMNDVMMLDDDAQRSKAIDHAYQVSDAEFRRVNAKNAANYRGIFEGWGMSGDPKALRMLEGMGQADAAMSGAYRQVRENWRAWRDRWGNDLNNPQRWDEFRVMQGSNDSIFKQAFRDKRAAEVKMGGALAEIYEGLYGPAAGEAARKWWDDVTRMNDEIVKREQDFRGYIKQAQAAGVPSEMIAAEKAKYYSETKIYMIAELEKINAEGIARLERVIKRGGGGGDATVRRPKPTPPAPSEPAPAAAAIEAVEATPAEAAPVSAETKTPAAETMEAPVNPEDEINALMAEAEQRKSREATAKEQLKAAVWDVAEQYWGKGANYNRTILQDGFALVNALRNPDYGGIPNLTWLDDERLTPDLVRTILEKRKALKETNAAAAAEQSFEVTAKKKERQFNSSQITENTSLLRAIALHGGLNMELRLDLTGEKKPKGVPGMFTRKGFGIDDMARMLADDGYPIDMNRVDDTGGLNQLRGLIDRARNGEAIYPVGHDYDAEIRAAENAYVETMMESAAIDSTLWQSEFDAAVQAADLNRVYELIGDMPEDLTAAARPDGEAWNDYVSRVADEVAVEYSNRIMAENVAEQAAQAEITIQEAEYHAEAVTQRTMIMEQLQEAFRLGEDQVAAYSDMSDAVAGWYARMTGESVDDFYNRYFKEVRRGVPPETEQPQPKPQPEPEPLFSSDDIAQAKNQVGETIADQPTEADAGTGTGMLPGMNEPMGAGDQGQLFGLQPGEGGSLNKMDAGNARSVYDVDTTQEIKDNTGATLARGDIVLDADGQRHMVQGANMRGSIITNEGKLLDPREVKRVASQPDMFSMPKPEESAATEPQPIDKGMVEFKNYQATITAFEAADFSTVIHETGHIYRRVLKDVAERTQNPYVLKDLQLIEEWAGATNGRWTVEAEEKFARGFERYITEGHAPTAALKAAFESFKRWMLGVYQAITGSSIDVKLTDEVRRVFDRMLGAENTRLDIETMLKQMHYDPKKWTLDPYGNIVQRPEFKISVDKAAVAEQVEALDIDGLKARLDAAKAKRAAGQIPDGPDAYTYDPTEPSRWQSWSSMEEAPVKTSAVRALKEWTLQAMKNPESPVNQLFQRVHHGSPADFPRFSTEYIGTGEGAQAYGWGLYFAESREIAEHYRQKLAGVTYKGQDYKTLSQAAAGMETYPVIDVMRKMYDGATFENARESVLNYYTEQLQDHILFYNLPKDLPARVDALPDWMEVTYNQMNNRYAIVPVEQVHGKPWHGYWETAEAARADALEFMNTLLAEVQNDKQQLEFIKTLDKKDFKTGQLYGVEIPDDGYLLLDRPLSEQPEKVQQAVDKLLLERGWDTKEVEELKAEYKALMPEYDRLLNLNMPFQELLKTPVQKRLTAIREMLDYKNSLQTGWDAYSALAKGVGPKAASLALRDAGIVGNKFADGDTRGSLPYVVAVYIDGEFRQNVKRLSIESAREYLAEIEAKGWKGEVKENPEIKYNYVIFDDTDVEIVERFYQREPAQRVKMDTPAFREWFGKSQVVDQDGKPQSQYHSGTFNETEDGVPVIGENGMHFGTKAAAEERVRGKIVDDFIRDLNIEDMGDDEWVWSSGADESLDVFGTEEEAWADANQAAEQYADSMMDSMDEGVSMTEVYLAIENPKRVKDQKDNWAAAIAKAKQEGYDGIVYRNQYEDIGSDSFIAFYPEQIKSVNNRGTWSRTDPNILFQREVPAGKYEEAAGFTPSGAGLDAMWREKVRPVLSAMEQGAMDRIDAPQLQGDMPQEVQAMLRKYAGQVKNDMASTKLATVRHGERTRDFALLNYSKRYGIDRHADFVVPYQLYTSRTMFTTMARMMNNPALFSNYARLKMQQERYERDVPERLRGKVRIPAPWLPDWAGDGLYIDPMRSLFFPENILRQFQSRERDKNYQVIEAERVLQEWQTDKRYSDAEILEAVNTQQGKIWERAWEEAVSRRESETASPADFFTSFFGPAWYLSTPLNLAGIKVPGISKGDPSKVNTVPLGNTARALDTVTNDTWAEPFGNLIGLIGKGEDRLRESFDLPTGGEYAEYYTKRQVANMVAEGKITAEDAQVAMIEKAGPIWDEAAQRVDMEMAMRVPLAAVTYAGLHEGAGAAAQAAVPSMFGASLLPAGELEYRGLKDEWDDAWKLADAGDTKAVSRFFDNYPEYEAYLAKNKDDGELLRSFLIGEIWDSYMALGETNQKLARAEMGEEFQQMFLDKETRSYETLTNEQLVQWAQMLNARVPKPNPTPNPSPNADAFREGSQAEPLNLYDESVTQITDLYFTQRREQFPNYYAEQAAYYSLAKSDRPKYLAAHPNLKAYWEWNRKWKTAYPEYEPIFTGNAFDRVDTSSWMPGLEEAVQQAAYTGDLPDGARAALMNQWVLAGKPMDDFDTWVKSVVMPAMLYDGR